METNEVYCFWFLGISGAPEGVHGIHITAEKDPLPKPLDLETCVYWGLSDRREDIPLLIHVYFEGELPDERQRDQMNAWMQKTVWNWLLSD